MSAFSNFDDLQFSGLGAENTALCEVCRDTVYVDSNGGCKVCGHDTSTAGSAPAVSTSTPASMVDFFRRTNGGRGGEGADDWTEYTGSLLGLTAEGQRGISAERIQAMLADIGFLGGEGAFSTKPPPASKKIVSKLVRIKVTEDDINQVEAVQKNQVTFKGTGQSAVVIPAVFGPRIVEEITCECILADPVHGHTSLAIERKAVEGKVLVVKRGKSSFAAKAKLAEEMGAAALLVINTADVWPFIMGDSTGEGKAVQIPCVMIRKDQGEKVLTLLEGGSATLVFEKPEAVETQCGICLEEYKKADELLQLPCVHFFHTSCIMSWLDVTNSCPLCRHQLQTDDPAYEQQRRAANGANGNDTSDLFFS